MSEFEPRDQFATLIVWRSLEVLDLPLRARTLLLDLHDMPIAGEMSAARLEKVDGVMVKSHFQHSALPPAARQRPCAVIPNGVDGEVAAQVVAEVAAEARSAEPVLVYTSSYDRGLEEMLRHGWRRIRGAMPTATLHLYYGWQTHELMCPKSEWREMMRELIASSAGVVDHGRVGQRELLLAKARADLHYYVTTWPEIDCIAVRESAMVGTVPLTSAGGVFGEKEYCVRVKGDPREAAMQREAARVAIDLVKKGARAERTAALEAETWDAVAARWLGFVL